MPAYASWQDIRPPLTDNQIEEGTFLLERAARVIRRAFRDVDDRIASGSLLVEDVADISVDMVQRVLNRTPGIESETDQRGPFARTVRYSNPDAGLYLTDDEKALLSPTGQQSRSAGYIWLA